MNNFELPYILSFAGAAAIIAAYAWHGLRRWERYIGVSVGYHRDRLRMLLGEPGSGGDTREAARLMLAILERQFLKEMKSGGGYARPPFRLSRGGKSSLASMDEVFSMLFRDRMFGHSSVYDVRIDRLYHTLSDTMLGWHMVHSLLVIPVLLFLDIRLLLCVSGAARGGTSLLFRDIALGRV